MDNLTYETMGYWSGTEPGMGLGEQVLVLADLQVPFHDTRAIEAIRQYAADLQPGMIVFLGDILDFPTLTTKFTRSHTEPSKVLEEIGQARDIILSFERLTDKVVFVEGNHEARLTTYVQERAPELEAFMTPGSPLNLEKLLDVPKMEYYGPYGSAFIHKGFVFKHGDSVSKYGAEKELLMEGSSGMSGHLHRFQTHMRTDRGGAHAWYCIGCLCHVSGPNQPPAVHKGLNRLQNWQQGFAVIHFAQDVFNVYPVVITNGKFVSPEGRTYEGR
jgi:predicted phosphodiesterase